jgi:N-acetylneuraminic acid mutarotase
VPGNYVTEVDVYDPSTDHWMTVAPLPMPSRNLAVVAAGGKLYAIGGENSKGRLATVEEYDPAANNWTERPALPSARDDLGVGTMDGKLYAVGGRGDMELPIDRLDEYHLGSHTAD